MKRLGDRVSARERLEIARRMILLGESPITVKRRFIDGFTLPDGRKLKVHRNVAGDDLRQLGREWLEAHDDPAVVEAIAGAAFERLGRIAVAAMERKRAVVTVNADKSTSVTYVPDPAFHAAIQANLALVRLAGIRAPRWRQQGGEESRIGTEEELGTLTDEELDEELVNVRKRVARLELLPDLIEGEVVEGSSTARASGG